jgi:hypothetical protein
MNHVLQGGTRRVDAKDAKEEEGGREGKMGAIAVYYCDSNTRKIDIFK